MKSKIVTIILINGLLAGTISLTGCSTKKKGQEIGKEQKADSTAIAYACPMHPEVTGKDGDKCPKCGMKLEPLKANDSTKMDNH